MKTPVLAALVVVLLGVMSLFIWAWFFWDVKGAGDAPAVVPGAIPAAVDGTTAAAWLPLEDGLKRRYEVRDGARRSEIVYRIDGGDMRDLPDGTRVPFTFLMGRFADEDDEIMKTIVARAPDGPRLFYLDVFSTRFQFDPPLPLLAERPHLDAEWAWSGEMTTDRKTTGTTGRLRVEEIESIRVPAGDFECLRAEYVFESAQLTMTCWYAEDVGLVRLDATHGTDEGEPRRLVMRLLED